MLRTAIHSCGLVIFSHIFPSLVLAQPSQTPLVELRRTVDGPECASGEVYVDGDLVALFTALPTNPLFAISSAVFEAKISKSKETDGIDTFSVLVLTAVDGNQSASQLRLAMPDKWSLSFSKSKPRHSRDRLGSYLLLGSLLDNRACEIASHRKDAGGWEGPLSWEQTSARVEQRLGGSDRAWVFINKEIEKLWFSGKDNESTFEMLQPTTPYCRLPIEKGENPTRLEQTFGLTQCIRWRYSGTSDAATFIETGRSLTTVILRDEKIFGTLLGLPLSRFIRIPIQTISGAGPVLEERTNEDPVRTLGSFVRQEK
jgi:hypothetical protein